MRYFQLLLPVIFFSSLMGCESSDDAASNTEVMVSSASGTSRSLNGTWFTNCYFNQDGFDEQDVIITDGSTTERFRRIYDSADWSCSGQIVSNTLLVRDTGMKATGNYTGSGWVDFSCSNVGAPLNGAGTGYLSNTPAMTVVTADDWTSPVPLFIDDTDSEWRLYAALDDCGDADADGNPDYVSNFVYFRKTN